MHMTILPNGYIRSIELDFLCSKHMAPLIEPLFTYVEAISRVGILCSLKKSCKMRPNTEIVKSMFLNEYSTCMHKRTKLFKAIQAW